jgi:hypothetical protein
MFGGLRCSILVVVGTFSHRNLRSCYPRGRLDTVHRLLSGGCGDSNTEREFPSDKVSRRDDRGIVGVEPFSPHGLGVFSVHTVLDVRRGLTVPHGKARHPQGMTGRGIDGLSERFCGADAIRAYVGTSRRLHSARPR